MSGAGAIEVPASGSPTIRPMGPTAVLVECAPGSAARLAARAATCGVEPGRHGVIDVVPAARTLLIDCVDPGSLSVAVGVVTGLVAEASSPAAPVAETVADEVEIPVCFDGPDLDAIAERTGTDPRRVVEMICAAPLEVAFCGFAPGFAYMTGLPPALHVPRRDHPRPRVPSGSFAIAAGYAAVYPSSSPGGWHLLGSTTFEVWSLSRRPPAVLRPGTRVRIVAEAGSTA